MKTLLPILLLAGALAARPASVTLAWNPNTDLVTGYKVFIGTNSAVYYSSNVVVGPTNTTTTFSNLTGGAAYFFAAKAYRETGTNYIESVFSAEVAWVVSPHAPAGLLVIPEGTNTVSFYFSTPGPGPAVVSASADLETWREFARVGPLDDTRLAWFGFSVVADRPRAFWRLD